MNRRDPSGSGATGEGQPVPLRPPGNDRHRDVRGGSARAAIFGANDGLVSNVALILGVAGASVSADTIRLAGIAGLLAGAASMAAGEYISMRAQSELLARELDLERRQHHHDPAGEIEELAEIYRQRGLPSGLARRVADALMRDPEIALEAHAREELGIDPEQLGSPVGAASSSFLAFALGAVIPLLPWFLASGQAALLGSIVLSAAAATTVGVLLARFTGQPAWRSAVRQVAIGALAAGATYLVGSLIGASPAA